MSGAADGVYFVRMPTRDERSKGMTSSPGSPATDCWGALQVEVIRSWDALDALWEEWDRLLGASGSASVFLTPIWIAAWRDANRAAGEPLVLVCRTDHGVLRGIAPLYTCTTGPLGLLRVARFIGDASIDSDNLDMIAARGHEAMVVEAVLSALADVSGSWDLLELRHIPRESPMLARVRAGALARGWLLDERASPHLVVALGGSWSDVLAGLSKKARWSATYSDRHLARAGDLRSRHCERHEDLPYFLDALFKLHQERWSRRGSRGNFRDAAHRAFHRALAARLLDDGCLDLDLLELDGRPIAAHLGGRHAGTYYLLDGGFDPDLALYSPGVVLTGRVMQRIIGDGLTHYDFLEGDEPYKRRWSPRVTEYVQLRLARPMGRGGRFLALARTSGRVRAAVKDQMPALWAFARRRARRVQP